MLSALGRFLLEHRVEFAARVGEHVQLVVLSSLVAAAIGIPLGLVAAHRPRLARPIVGSPTSRRPFPASRCSGSSFPCRSSAASARARRSWH